MLDNSRFWVVAELRYFHAGHVEVAVAEKTAWVEDAGVEFPIQFDALDFSNIWSFDDQGLIVLAMT